MTRVLLSQQTDPDAMYKTLVLATVGLLLAATAPGGAAAHPATPQSAQQAGAPLVRVQPPQLRWGNEDSGVVPYEWSAVVDNPNARAVLVKVRLDFVTDDGQVVHQDWVNGQVGANGSAVLQQSGSVPADQLEQVTEARGEPAAWWADEPYQIRTLAAFVDGLQRLEVFFVLEDWQGRPVTADGTADLYVVERERARATFEGGGMQRRLTTLYARRFNVSRGDFSRRRIGFINTDYKPPALTLGPIHYSIFDQEPRGDEGLVRVVFRTASGVQIVAEDRVYF